VAKLYHKNPRQITAKQYEALAVDLAELGDLGGIVHDLNSDEIIGGNQRSRVFDLNACDVVLTEILPEPDAQGTVAHGYVLWKGNKYAYRQVRWTERQAERANIVANKRGGTWDMDILADQFEVSDLLDWGFEPFELGIENAKPAAGDTEAQVDRAEELRQQWGVELGQMWQLGEHKLICGDCTDAATVARVMGGERAQLVFTDPPYGVDYEGGRNPAQVPRQKLSGDKSGALYGACMKATIPFCENNAAWYLWFAGTVGKPVYDAVAAAGYSVRAMIVWNKIDAHYGNFMAQYMQKHEPCLYCVKGAPVWHGATNEVTVWDVKQPTRNEFHPTEKPVELAEKAIRNSSDAGAIVADWFLGSGTTIIACENLGRRCRACEISPGYVGVALERYFQHTGVQPVLLESAAR